MTGPGWETAVADGGDHSHPQLVEQRGRRVGSVRSHCTGPSIPGYLGRVRIAVLSGAGISAKAGCRRSATTKRGCGRSTTLRDFQHRRLAEVPERVWAWYLWRHHLVKEVQPNAGHRAVAGWQDHAEVTVITQNVDDLHERAGSRPFIICTAASRSSGATPAARATTVRFRICRCRSWRGFRCPAVRRADPARHRMVRRGAAGRAVARPLSERSPPPKSWWWSEPRGGLPRRRPARYRLGQRGDGGRSQPRTHPAVRNPSLSQSAAATVALPTLLQRLPELRTDRPSDQPALTARPIAISATGSSAHAGSVHWCRRLHAESRPGDSTLGVPVGVAVPAILGQMVASASRWIDPCQPALATCSK